MLPVDIFAQVTIPSAAFVIHLVDTTLCPEATKHILVLQLPLHFTVNGYSDRAAGLDPPKEIGINLNLQVDLNLEVISRILGYDGWCSYWILTWCVQ